MLYRARPHCYRFTHVDHASELQTDAKKRLVRAALQVFASKGYDGASTREICRLADVNVAGIHYHFGDKASLYREVFRIPEQMGPFPLEMADPNAPVRNALVALLGRELPYRGLPFDSVVEVSCGVYRFTFEGADWTVPMNTSPASGGPWAPLRPSP